MSETKYMDEIKAALGDIVEPVTARLDAIEETQNETKAQVEDLLARPVNEPVITGGDGGEYRGYQLKAQGRSLIKDGHLEQEDRDKVAKFAIDFVQGVIFNKPEAKAAMQEGTDSEGGYLVPDEWAASMMSYGLLNSFALADCDVIPMKHQILHLPAELTRVSVAWTAEEVAATQTEPTFDEVVLTAQKLDGYNCVHLKSLSSRWSLKAIAQGNAALKLREIVMNAQRLTLSYGLMTTESCEAKA